jgi:probable HAF family extracellular repeat protein
MRKAGLLAVLLAASVALGQGTYTQIDAPTAFATECEGINNAGEIVGWYTHADGNVYGFILRNGVFTTIERPDRTQTYLYGINDVGQIVGYSPPDAFLYDVQTQTFTEISYPGGYGTVAQAINNSGTIVGIWNTSLTDEGFELIGSTYTLINPPVSTYVARLGISGSGEVVGSATNHVIGIEFSFSGGRYQLLPIPQQAGVAGINSTGKALVGTHSATVGFLFDKTLTPLQFPGGAITQANGVNDSMEVVGYFNSADGLYHGFLWTP